MNTKPTIHICETAGGLFQRSAQQFVRIANESIQQRSRFVVALSGGSTPRGLYEQLVSQHAADLNWQEPLFFFSDERTVPPDHPDSNYGLAREALLRPLGIRDEQVFRMRGEDEPSTAAAEYANAIASVVGVSSRRAFPAFDLVLLGIGEDGHTASLFPHTAALEETKRCVVANDVPQLNTCRLTITAPVINAARHVMVMATGARKAGAVVAILKGPSQPHELPGQLIRPERGKLNWFLDREASSKL